MLGYGSYAVRSVENGKVYKVTRVDLVKIDECENFSSVLESEVKHKEYALTGKGGMLQPASISTIKPASHDKT